MSRSMVLSLRHFRTGAVALLAILLLAVPASAAACGEEGPEDTGPLVTEAKLSPVSMPAGGGTAVISARVEDDCGVQQVYAEVYGGEGIFQSFQMLPAEIIDGHSAVYRTEFQVPANFQESAVSYQGNVSAEDTNGAYAYAYAGDIEVAGLPPFDEPPYVWDQSTTPHTFGGFGGTAKIGVSASDTRSLGNVYAIVTYPNGSEKEVGLEAISFSRFEGSLKLPGNPGSVPRTYSVSVFAEDDIGQTTGAYAGTITVEPHGTPNPGGLRLQPNYWRYGSVKIGATDWHSVTLENFSGAGAGAVSGFVRTSGPQYVLAGAGPEGIPFTLKPGEQQSLEVGFRPAVRGQQNGRLLVVRTDGNQPDLGIALFGWGSK